MLKVIPTSLVLFYDGYIHTLTFTLIQDFIVSHSNFMAMKLPKKHYQNDNNNRM